MRLIPDFPVMQDGQPVTPDRWAARREEILDILRRRGKCWEKPDMPEKKSQWVWGRRV